MPRSPKRPIENESLLFRPVTISHDAQAVSQVRIPGGVKGPVAAIENHRVALDGGGVNPVSLDSIFGPAIVEGPVRVMADAAWQEGRKQPDG